MSLRLRNDYAGADGELAEVAYNELRVQAWEA